MSFPITIQRPLGYRVGKGDSAEIRIEKSTTTRQIYDLASDVMKADGGSLIIFGKYPGEMPLILKRSNFLTAEMYRIGFEDVLYFYPDGAAYPPNARLWEMLLPIHFGNFSGMNLPLEITPLTTVKDILDQSRINFKNKFGILLDARGNVVSTITTDGNPARISKVPGYERGLFFAARIEPFEGEIFPAHAGGKRKVARKTIVRSPSPTYKRNPLRSIKGRTRSPSPRRKIHKRLSVRSPSPRRAKVSSRELSPRRRLSASVIAPRRKFPSEMSVRSLIHAISRGY
jgi:hypothetical protein